MLNFSIIDKKKVVQNNPQLSSLFVTVCKLIADKVSSNYLFDVSIVDSKAIRKINKKYRKIAKSTDVISFAFHDAQGIKTPLLGEIFINYQKAKIQAKKYGHTYEREMIFLFVHGILHLLGYDHIMHSDEQKMNEMQNSLMKQLNLLK